MYSVKGSIFSPKKTTGCRDKERDIVGNGVRRFTPFIFWEKGSIDNLTPREDFKATDYTLK